MYTKTDINRSLDSGLSSTAQTRVLNPKDDTALNSFKNIF